MRDLTAGLLRRYLNRDVPVLVGLSSTYLYGCSPRSAPTCEPDDVRGLAAGHFVVLCGYDKRRRKVLVADPYLPNLAGLAHYYEVTTDRLVCAILLGVLTYDANLLIIEPGRRAGAASWTIGIKNKPPITRRTRMSRFARRRTDFIPFLAGRPTSKRTE